MLRIYKTTGKYFENGVHTEDIDVILTAHNENEMIIKFAEWAAGIETLHAALYPDKTVKIEVYCWESYAVNDFPTMPVRYFKLCDE